MTPEEKHQAITDVRNATTRLIEDATGGVVVHMAARYKLSPEAIEQLSIEASTWTPRKVAEYWWLLDAATGLDVSNPEWGVKEEVAHEPG